MLISSPRGPQNWFLLFYLFFGLFSDSLFSFSSFSSTLFYLGTPNPLSPNVFFPLYSSSNGSTHLYSGNFASFYLSNFFFIYYSPFFPGLFSTSKPTSLLSSFSPSFVSSSPFSSSFFHFSLFSHINTPVTSSNSLCGFYQHSYFNTYYTHISFFMPHHISISFFLAYYTSISPFLTCYTSISPFLIGVLKDLTYYHQKMIT